MTVNPAIDSRRIHSLRDGTPGSGPVVYWMSRDQRVHDNWALLYAQDYALKCGLPLIVLFCLVPDFLDAARRHYDFMIRGLEEVERELGRFRIPMALATGRPETEIPRFLKHHRAALLVTDFSPLRLNRRWKTAVTENITVPFHEVDAHNIVPCRIASDKREYAAYTIRPKINRLLSEFLTGLPRIKKHRVEPQARFPSIDWTAAGKTLKVNTGIRPVSWITPGESAARQQLDTFLETRLAAYHSRRNDPNAAAESNLSPYLHFGQISAQRIVLELGLYDGDLASREAFAEQLIIRRELSDNFCLHNPDYDSVDGFPDWARKTLDEHRRDIRPHSYSRDQLESAATHDDLWNAAQTEMAVTGKMHGYMRMYWAKKILEWSPSPEKALASAIYLNDAYELDGRDPNGYAGIAWSIGGVHDRPWFEREIYGKIRYMSYDGCRRKFDINAYIERARKLRDEAGS